MTHSSLFLVHLMRESPKLILKYDHLLHFSTVLHVKKQPPPCSDLFIGGLSRGGLHPPVSDGLLHTLSCARQLMRGAERKTFKYSLVSVLVNTEDRAESNM